MPDAASQPEAQARRRIDALLEASGWTVQDRSGVNLSAGAGVALRELPTSGGEADYGLFLGQELVGVVEAKKVGATLGGVEAQTLAYASETLPGLQVPVLPLPFRLLQRIHALIKEASRTPFEGSGKPELLRHALSGFWSHPGSGH